MTKQSEQLEKARKVLDYWYTIEFLAQDKFDDMREVRYKLQKAQKDFAEGKFRGKSIWSYRELKNACAIYDVVSEDAMSCGMKKWGNITVTLGRIKREACIECIAKILPKTGEEERPERTSDSIAWASLQIAPDGTYVAHSLSLSTIIWSMNQIKNSKGSLSGSIDEKKYRSAVEEMEKNFFGGEDATRDVDTGNADAEGQPERMQEFSPNAVTVKLLKELFQQIKKDYINGNIELTEAGQEYQEVYSLYFQLFADEKSRAKLDEDSYLGLSHDYFSEDIKYILQVTEEGEISAGDGMGEDMIRYITALDEDGRADKIDLVSPQNKERFFQQISEILDVGNAPLGKWPSKFMPAFMQQIAVNLCIRKGTTGLYGVNGRVFSVNGPPGTGKTTLLKEIVVSNIIERAILMADYEDPDEAFEKQSFLHGEKEGNAYSKYIRNWYRLKNDNMNDYSILVTSCNNAAVENVSKELPLGTSIINDLKPASDDAEECKAMLDEVSRLFDAAQAQTYETISGKSCQDIYFTEYAKELFQNEGVWGLIAAPLGRKANISNFFHHVLSPLLWGFYVGRDFKDKRIKKYEQARKEFKSQLEEVQKMQEQLRGISALIHKREQLAAGRDELERRLIEKRVQQKARIKAGEQSVLRLRGRLDEELGNMRSVQAKKEKLENIISETEQEEQVQVARKREFLEKEAAARNSAGFFDRLLNKKKVAANELLGDEYHEEVIKAEAEIVRLTRLLDEQKEALQRVQTELDEAVFNKNQIDAEIAERQSAINGSKQHIRELEHAWKRMLAELNDIEAEYLDVQRKFTQDNSVDAGVILDFKFVERLLSADTKSSTDAQVADPWFTMRYNIAREKLFYYAMKLNKEFVLSSKSCRDNFKTLGQYWGMLQGDEKERVIFHQEDKEKFAGALYQTLFLLVPVLSSTFASLGTFLRDAKQAGVIGTLIVDEAGQAQPQMAVGALYRSRKAMIVGDPKQVEPVVTDDLNLLKRAFDDVALKPYKSKTISVQSFADNLNSFGTYLDNGTDYPEWVGCPLLVHRRCISPMYDISNEISYQGIMKQQTREPDEKKAKTFVYDKSQWINVAGKEKGNKNHFVVEQARKVCEILEHAFSKSDNPSLYIISPFTSVITGMKAFIREYKRTAAGTNLEKCGSEWIGKNIGTVHTFQGKEANEVIFLLGCDKSKESRGAVNWVNANIVNVAATRAKFRFYIIGDEEAWQHSACIKKAKAILDTFAIRKIKDVLEEQLPEKEQAEALMSASASLPPVTAFRMDTVEDENGFFDCSVDTHSLLQELDESFASDCLSKEQLQKFGFQSMEEVKKLPREVQNNLELGMKLFYLLYPVYKVNSKLDASCCAILFCKAMELQMKECFEENLKAILPEAKLRGQGKGRGLIALKDANSRELTLGAFQTLLKANCAELGKRMENKGKKEYGAQWWEAFVTRLHECTDRRNKCCHSGLFSWKDQSHLLAEMFRRDKRETGVKMEGILFESKIGKLLR